LRCIEASVWKGASSKHAWNAFSPTGGDSRYTKDLTFLTVGYDQLASIFPLLVAAPRYFTGAITLGVLTQIGNAFGRVQGSLSWFVESYASLASWRATVDRLLTFQDAIDLATARREQVASINMLAVGVAICARWASSCGCQAGNVSCTRPTCRLAMANAS
jgi:hypothetical protein